MMDDNPNQSESHQFLRGPADGMRVREKDLEDDSIEIVTERGIYQYDRTPEGDYLWRGTVKIQDAFKPPKAKKIKAKRNEP